MCIHCDFLWRHDALPERDWRWFLRPELSCVACWDDESWLETFLLRPHSTSSSCLDWLGPRVMKHSGDQTLLTSGGNNRVNNHLLISNKYLPEIVHCIFWMLKCWISCCRIPQCSQSRSCLSWCSATSCSSVVPRVPCHVSSPLPVASRFRCTCLPDSSSRCSGWSPPWLRSDLAWECWGLEVPACFSFSPPGGWFWTQSLQTLLQLQ